MTEAEVKHSTGDDDLQHSTGDDDLQQGVRDETWRPWEDLHESVLIEISSRLLFQSRIMFRLVCKSWNIKTPCKFIGEFSSPHLILPRKIFHPLCQEFYPMEFPGAPLRVAIDNWFLLESGYHALSFYNPFTKQEIKLPHLQSLPKSMCVSSPPTSLDWMVVVTRSVGPVGDPNIIVDTIKCGEHEWSTSTFEQKENFFELSSCNGVSCKGRVYFLGKDGNLMIHDLKKKKFYFHKAPESLRLQLIGVRERYLLECKGKIVAVFVGIDGSWIRVCQWNSSMLKWEVLSSLPKKALFVSRTMSVCETVSEESGMDNKIYFTRLVDDHCVFYSMATKKFHTFHGYSSPTFHGAMKLYKPSTWIYPS